MSHFSRNKFIRVFAVAAVSFFLSNPLPAAQSSYDAYTRLVENPKEESLTEKALALPAWPLDLLRGGMDKTFYWFDRYHVSDKLQWVYERLTDYGLYVNLLNVDNFSASGLGADLDVVKLLRQKGNFPYLRLKNGVGWSPGEFFKAYSELGWDKTEETGAYGSFYFNFEDRPSEDFYGIGPDTSRGDSHNFKSKTTALEMRLGYSLSLHTDLKASFGYKTVDIDDGEDGGKGRMDRNVPGAGGGDMLIGGLELVHDTRDFPDDPHKGGVERFKVSYHEGVDGYDFGYFKLRGEISRFHEIFSERQVLGGRIVAEHNAEVNHQAIPFFDMARLGGYGAYPSLGDTHRGYQQNRFFGESLLLANLEYRYKVWEHRDFAMDAVLFWDEGQVFNEFSKFQFKDFRGSAGGGFRFKILRKSILSFEVARSSEGTQIYARSQTPF